MTRRRSPLALALALAAGCSIVTHVDPVPEGAIPAVCIAENDQVWSKEFLPALRDAFERRAIATTVYRDARPADCRYHVGYTASWKWDVAVFLRYAEIAVYDGERLIGQATYDARGAFARLDKFGRTTTKLERLVNELLRSVNQGTARQGT
jgi:hypothetical protein